MASKRSTSASCSNGSKLKKNKRQVSKDTFIKWQKVHERQYQTMTWLRCTVDSSDKSLVATLWCEVCRKYERRIDSKKNFSRAWIDGSTNHKTSNVVDHASSEQHKAAMALLCREQAKNASEPVTSYSTIARCLHNPSMDPAVRERIKKKFDIAYLMAKENLPFTKYPAIHDLLERNGVELGFSYKTRESAHHFTHFIADSQRNNFHQMLSNTKFFSFLMDGSTDKGKVENELIMIQYCSVDEKVEEVRSLTRFLKVVKPAKADADGLIKCLGEGLKVMGITDILSSNKVLDVESHPILVGGGTDGAAVNISDQNGMKGKLQHALPWLHWSWCFAHCLELACKDSLCTQLFKDIEDMLLKLYYLYERSPKKCRELHDIVSDLKEVFELPDGGNLPVRSRGSRWISHKRNALQRVINRYGAYLSHLTALIEDKTIKSTDRQKLKGYLLKWRDGRILIGCAFYIDILQSPSFLSLSLQGDSLNVVHGLHHILKSHQSLRKLALQDPLQWPTVKVVRSKVVDEDGSKTYQGVYLKKYTDSAVQICKTQALSDLNRLDDNMRSRLEWSDIGLLRSILQLLDTQSWLARSGRSKLTLPNKDEDQCETDECLDEIKSSVDKIVEFFRLPLEAKGVELYSILDEGEEAVEYSRKYLNIEKENYQKIWYRLHTAPDSSSWQNLLHICNLLFSLPFSTAKVERTFSILKAIKTEKRTSLTSDTLEDLLEIKAEGPSLTSFSSDSAVDLWWKESATTRRALQKPRKKYKKRKDLNKAFTSTTADSSNSECEDGANLALEQWDIWFDFGPGDEIVSESSTSPDTSDDQDCE